ncbi:hypothetical protein EVAR_82561_1 [Eumeta japonica]|uniref:Uncharacterized protein n=1 Tax=Eumeta variegata TaxID=151549 RepID=A0A4C1UX13_EUMVA|nr:hypothetical protein EVAR_82561_1 [Eumeta japonica]
MTVSLYACRYQSHVAGGVWRPLSRRARALMQVSPNAITAPCLHADCDFYLNGRSLSRCPCRFSDSHLADRVEREAGGCARAAVDLAVCSRRRLLRISTARPLQLGDKIRAE